ncbi:MAG: Uncharacterised protein [Hyphomonas sp. TMED17]|nr:MAG: Uncharacterised protein [Hyphomonas sp. TMED17]
MALLELRKGIEWLETQLSTVGPGEKQVENVMAYDAVARSRLNDT